jgi:hypothetical protein
VLVEVLADAVSDLAAGLLSDVAFVDSPPLVVLEDELVDDEVDFEFARESVR